MKKIILILLTSFFFSTLQSQELNCTVTIDTKSMVTNQATERAIFKDMEKAISEFINSQDWTEDDFEVEERIECTLYITVTEMPTQNSFKATAQVIASRPIYNSIYSSNLFQYVDRNFDFSYLPSQPLIYNDNSFTNNLTSMLAFYAYTILTMDYDSFSLHGGSKYAEKALNVANIAEQSAGEIGWKRNQDKRNRYWLAENLMSQQMLLYREAMYKYHRLGLDAMLVSKEEAVKEIEGALQKINQANKIKGPAILTNIFFDAKATEIVGVFKSQELKLKQKMRNLLVRLDPTNTKTYNILIQK